MKFGISIPNCVEGMAYPIRLADHRGVLRLAVEAEELGYDSVLTNDHMSTMPYVRESYAEAPRFYEPLITLTYVASHTSRIKLMTGVVVMPMREPVLLAKQAATLDQISDGRLILGLGVGAYRAEFESVKPDLADAPRAELVSEGIQSLRLLFGERRASFAGKHYRFDDVEMFPKPLQDPFPIYSCGNAGGTIRRAARWGSGWMPASLPPGRLEASVQELHAIAAAEGRDGSSIEVAPQLVLCIDRDSDRAKEKFTHSQVYEHLVSLMGTTLKGLDLEGFTSQNLIGSPAEIIERVKALGAAGATQMAGMIIAADTEREMSDQLKMFAAEVMPAFATEEAA